MLSTASLLRHRCACTRSRVSYARQEARTRKRATPAMRSSRRPSLARIAPTACGPRLTRQGCRDAQAAPQRSRGGSKSGDLSRSQPLGSQQPHVCQPGPWATTAQPHTCSLTRRRATRSAATLAAGPCTSGANARPRSPQPGWPHSRRPEARARLEQRADQRRACVRAQLKARAAQVARPARQQQVAHAPGLRPRQHCLHHVRCAAHTHLRVTLTLQDFSRLP